MQGGRSRKDLEATQKAVDICKLECKQSAKRWNLTEQLKTGETFIVLMQAGTWWKRWLVVLKVEAWAGHYVSSYRTRIVLVFLLKLLLLNELEQSKNYHLDCWRQSFSWVQTEKDRKVQCKYKHVNIWS